MRRRNPPRPRNPEAGRSACPKLERSPRSQQGFTLVEILIVTVIISIIAAMSVVSFIDALDKSRQRATVADMRALTKAIQTYTIDNNDPPTAPAIAILVQSLDLYSRSLPTTDHWGNPYEYTRDAAGNYTLQSFGKDGVDGDDISPDTKNEYHRDIVVSNGIFVAVPD